MLLSSLNKVGGTRSYARRGLRFEDGGGSERMSRRAENQEDFGEETD